MKEVALKERLDLLEKELNTLSETSVDISKLKEAIDDLNLEIKGLKVFLVRTYPEFKREFPEIIKKLNG
ncbi:MAG TPA: hypothetical protein DEP99_00590 [Nitrospiraceae bacterium]|nr:hypothetical protein [Nitrospiraceae bacterium]